MLTHQQLSRALVRTVFPIVLLSFGVAAGAAIPVPPSPQLTASEIIPQAAVDQIDSVSVMDSRFRVDESGAATLSVPLTVPQGSAGVTPTLSLDYSSLGGNGIAGKGWRLNAYESITRCRQTLYQDGANYELNFTNRDRFCLNGQKMILVSGGYGQAGSVYRLESDDQTKVTVLGQRDGGPDQFKVEKKDGSVSIFGDASSGSSSTSKQHLRYPTGASTDTVLTWAVRSSSDSVGNKIVFDYDDDEYGFRVKTILYSYDANSNWNSKISFSYEDRVHDVLQSYLSGYLVETSKRLGSISVHNKAGGNERQLRLYRVGYNTQNANSQLSELSSIRECYAADQGEVCTGPMVFEWAPVTTNLIGGAATMSFSLLANDYHYLGGTRFGDINGDGKQDIMWLEVRNGTQNVAPLQTWKYVLSQPDGSYGSLLQGPHVQVPITEIYHWQLTDYNVDGRMDLAISRRDNESWRVFLSKPVRDFYGIQGDWQIDRNDPIDMPAAYTSKLSTFRDLTGNGLSDMVTASGIANLQVGMREIDPSQPYSSDRRYRLKSTTATYSALRTQEATAWNKNAEALASGAGLDWNGDGVGDHVIKLNGRQPFLGIDYSALRYLVTRPDGGLELWGPNTDDGGAIPSAGVGHQFVDLNKDGLTDIVYLTLAGASQAWVVVKLSNGQSFENNKKFFLMNSTTYAAENFEDMKVQIVDYNGDGYADFLWHDIASNQLKVRLWDIDEANFSSADLTVMNNTSGNGSDAYSLADVNGDAALDVVRISTDAKRLDIFISTQVSQPPGKITKITNTIGGVTEISYSPLSDTEHYSKLDVEREQITCSGPVFGGGCTWQADAPAFYEALNGAWDLPSGTHSLAKREHIGGVPDLVMELIGPINVVTRVDSSMPVASDEHATSSISYYYHLGKIRALGQGFLGFKKLITVDEQTQVTTVTENRLDYPFGRRPIKTSVFTSQGNLLSETINDWRLVDDGGAQFGADGHLDYQKRFYQTYLYESKTIEYALSNNGVEQGGILSSVRSLTHTPDIYGNVPATETVSTQFDAQGAPEHVFRTYVANTFPVHAPYDYSFPPSNWDAWMGRLSSATATHQRDENADGTFEKTSTKTTAYTYIKTGPFRGLLESETIQPENPDLVQTQTYGYDAFGNPIKAKVSTSDGVRCDYYTSQYDSTGRYVDLTFDCLGRKTSRVISRNAFGQPTSAITYLDRTGTATKETQYAYTDRGFRYFESSESGAFSATTMSLADSDCPVSTAYVRKSYGPGSSSGADHTKTAVLLTKECFDILGRATRKAARHFSGQWVFSDVEYDSLGRVSRSSEPYFEGNTPSHWTSNSYDILGRVVQTDLPSRSGSSHDLRRIATSYDRLTTTVINPLGRSSTVEKNILDEKVKVTDNDGARIVFEYNAQGELIKTSSLGSASSPRSIETVLTYDVLGRKLSMDEPDKGYWLYEYNAFGELTKQTNAKSQYAVMTYDALGRITSKKDYQASGQVEGHATWQYDSGANALGQLDQVVDHVSGYAKLLSYDDYGRIRETVTSLGVGGSLGDHYEKVSYDQYGRVFQVFDASRDDADYSRRGVEHQYNTYGFKSALVDAEYDGGVTHKVYQETISVDERGQVLEEMLGNGVQRHREYEAHRGMLTSIRSITATNKVVQNIGLDRDLLGNVTFRSNSGVGSGSQVRGQSETYGYDSMNRLTSTVWSENLSSNDQQSVSYDVVGNITYKSDVGNYLYEQSCGCGPHAVTQAGSTVYQYDANGNMVRDSSGRRLFYTTFDKVYRVVNGGNSVHFAYGPDRARYLRKDLDSSGEKTTIYIGAVEKILNPDGTREWKRYISGSLMITLKLDSSGQVEDTKEHYFLKDHLGTTNFVLNGSGAVEQEMWFDPWGKRLDRYRDSGTTPWNPNALALLLTTQGFTGHEMVDAFGIINMNGRIYDSTIARFLQADIQVQLPLDTQSYNRYSYAHNNPVYYTDSSGYGLDIFDVLKIATAVLIGPTCPQCAAVIIGYMSAAQTLYYGGSFEDALIAGITSAAVAYVGAEYGQGFGFNIETLGYATLNGIGSVLQGGKFGHGFVAAGAGALSTQIPLGKASTWVGRTAQAAARITTSGTISKLTGGKFANGAATAAFAAIVSAGAQAARKPTPQEVTYARMSKEVYGLSQTDVEAGYQIDDYTLSELTTDESGLKAALFVKGDSQVVAFAGTSPGSGANWKANFRQAFGRRSAQYEAGKTYAASLDGNVHFTGHSLGGGIASAAAIVTGNGATVFNAAGVHNNTLNGIRRSNGAVTHFRSSFDVLQPINALTPSSVPGQQISIGPAGLHGMGGVCRAMGC